MAITAQFTRRAFLESMTVGAGALLTAPSLLKAEAIAPSRPTSLRVESGKELFNPSKHLKALGAFLLPQGACSNSTGFAGGSLALRRVGNEIRFLSDSHIYTSGSLYEVALPELRMEELLTAAIISQPCQSLYGGKKELWPLTSLRWDTARAGYWWTFGPQYNTQFRDAATIGFTRAADNAVSLFKVLPPGGNLWSRGNTLAIPDSFARMYLDGRNIGIGTGGYYSIIGGGSWGPCILAVRDISTNLADPLIVLGFPDGSGHRCARSGDYWHASPGWMGTDPDPKTGIGTWGGADEIGGENFASLALWLDEPAVEGVLFGASLGTGRIGYDAGTITSQGRANRLYVFRPQDLARVATGELKCWEPPPIWYDLKNPIAGYGGRISGAAFDPIDHRLYLCWTAAYNQGVEWYPMVTAYEVG